MTSRRAFLGVSAIGGLGLSLSAGAGWGETLLPSRRVTLSETFVPAEWTQAFGRQDGLHSADRAFWEVFDRQGAAPAMDAGELRLLTLPAPGLEAFDPAVAKRLAPVVNDRLAQAVRQGAGRVAGLASVSAFDPDAAREAERAVTRLGLSGVALGANRGMQLDNRQLWPLYDFAQSTRTPIYLPAAYAIAAGDAPYDALGRAGSLTGASADSGAHAAQLIFGGVFDAFPTLKVVLSRMGEATAYRYGQLVAAQEALGAAGPQKSIQTYFQRNIHLTTADLTSREVLGFCNQVLGQSRMVAMCDVQPAQHAEADLRSLTRVAPGQLLRQA